MNKTRRNKTYWFKRRIFKELGVTVHYAYLYAGNGIGYLSFDEFAKEFYPAYYSWITRNE